MLISLRASLAKKTIMTKLHIVRAVNTKDQAACLVIRKTVFIEEQQVPVELEIDGLDDEALHYLVSQQQTPCATARVRLTPKGAKVERMAVLKTHRQKGIGLQLLQFIMHDLQARALADQMLLSAQTHAIGFYEKLGFSVCSDEYQDAGIPHVDMQHNLV